MDVGEARAMIQTGTANAVRRVRVGDDIDGWQVSQIEQRRLVLSLDSRTATYTMFSRQSESAPQVTEAQRQPQRPDMIPANRDRRGF
jgi:hypothetical protein